MGQGPADQHIRCLGFRLQAPSKSRQSVFVCGMGRLECPKGHVVIAFGLVQASLPVVAVHIQPGRNGQQRPAQAPAPGGDRRIEGLQPIQDAFLPGNAIEMVN